MSLDNEDYQQLIHPWEVHFDTQWQQNFYFNPLTKESVWILPEDVQARVENYKEDLKTRERMHSQKNMTKYLKNLGETGASKDKKKKNKKGKAQGSSDDESEKVRKADEEEEQEEKDNEHERLDKIAEIKKRFAGTGRTYMERPARKQVEQSLSTQYAYKQGDEEYYIWYDKFLTDSKIKEKEPAVTRCDPELDSGYTKADVYDREGATFCIHFARGACCEGSNCRYYHRPPSQSECICVEQSRDIFGRARFANLREDMGGVGSFLKECRTLYVCDFRLPSSGNDPQSQMYEILWRHFSVWGDIEDINLIPGKGVAFIRYSHRCFAEFAKEAMLNQSLDQSEIITIKWANDDPNPRAGERTTMENEKMILDAVMKRMKRSEPQSSQTNVIGPQVGAEAQFQGFGVPEADDVETRKIEIMESCAKMSEVLKRIEENQEEVEDNGENFVKELTENFEKYRNKAVESQKDLQPAPENNNLPLFFK